MNAKTHSTLNVTSVTLLQEIHDIVNNLLYSNCNKIRKLKMKIYKLRYLIEWTHTL